MGWAFLAWKRFIPLQVDPSPGAQGKGQGLAWGQAVGTEQGRWICASALSLGFPCLGRKSRAPGARLGWGPNLQGNNGTHHLRAGRVSPRRPTRGAAVCSGPPGCAGLALRLQAGTLHAVCPWGREGVGSPAAEPDSCVCWAEGDSLKHKHSFRKVRGLVEMARTAVEGRRAEVSRPRLQPSSQSMSLRRQAVRSPISVFIYVSLAFSNLICMFCV